MEVMGLTGGNIGNMTDCGYDNSRRCQVSQTVRFSFLTIVYQLSRRLRKPGRRLGVLEQIFFSKNDSVLLTDQLKLVHILSGHLQR